MIEPDAYLHLPAPAKLNLFLHITGRRTDGYHELQTLFQFLDYGDELQFRRRNDGQIHLHTELPGVDPENNLIVQAARQLQRLAVCSYGVDIWLEKRLPVGGGVGGGSSDAATTLIGLNHLWKLRFEEDRLAELGLSLGADVPVFVRGRAAFAEGIGEKLTPVQPAEPWYLVLAPNVAVSTAEIFSDPLLTRDTPPIKVRTVLEGDRRNDCQPIVETRYPEVREALQWLNRYVPARLTGTGGCVFGGFPNKTEADKVSALLPETFQRFVAKGSNVSALHRKLGILF